MIVGAATAGGVHGLYSFTPEYKHENETNFDETVSSRVFYVLIVQHSDPPQELGYTSRAPNRKFPPTSHHDLQLSRHLRIDALNGITLCEIENIYYM